MQKKLNIYKKIYKVLDLENFWVPSANKINDQ